MMEEHGSVLSCSKSLVKEIPLEMTGKIRTKSRKISVALSNYHDFIEFRGGSEHGQLITVQLRKEFQKRWEITGMASRDTHFRNPFRQSSSKADESSTSVVSGDILVDVDGFSVSGLRLTEFKAFFDFKMRTSVGELKLCVIPAGAITIKLQDVIMYHKKSDGVIDNLKQSIIWNVRRNNKPFKAMLLGPSWGDFTYSSEEGDSDYNIISSKDFKNAIDTGRMIEYGTKGFIYGTRTPDELDKAYTELTPEELRTYFSSDGYRRRPSFDEAIRYCLKDGLTTKPGTATTTDAERTSQTRTIEVRLPQFTINFDDKAIEIKGTYSSRSAKQPAILFHGLTKWNPVGPINCTIVMSWSTTDRTDGPRNHNLEMALKLLPSIQPGIESQNRGYSHLFTLDHSSVAKYYEFGLASDQPCVLMDNAQWGTLNKYEHLSDELRLRVLAQVASGMDYLHENLIVHGDLKTENILLSGINADARIYGLETSTQLSSAIDPVKTPTGHPQYMSPEMVRLFLKQLKPGEVVNRPTDVWSFGCISYETLQAGKNFTPDKASNELISNENHGLSQVMASSFNEEEDPHRALVARLADLQIMEKNRPWEGFKVPEVVKEVLQACLEFDPFKRIGAGRLINKLDIFRKQSPNGNQIFSLV